MSITTDCIVGFPTETEQNFQESKGNLKLIHFSDIHIFPFSSRPFTAAGKSKNIVSVFQRKQRFNEINNLNKIEKHKYLVSFIDKTVTVLFEKSPSSTYQVGHSEYFFNVKVLTKIVLTNQLRKIKITKVIDGDVYGVLI
jgi:threonylcarbamoyladenosine tRNA methylthiotransferase MtaB